MFVDITIEATPNDSTKKFVLEDHIILKDETSVEFLSPRDCAASDLAMDLMNIPNVVRVMFGKNFISIQIDEKAIETWKNVERLACLAISEEIGSEKPLFDSEKFIKKEASLSDDPIVRQIEAIICDQVKPAVARDGGDVELMKFEDGVVYLKMKGACSGCPSSSQTLKYGIENMLKHYVPEVLEVREHLDTD